MDAGTTWTPPGVAPAARGVIGHHQKASRWPGGHLGDRSKTVCAFCDYGSEARSEYRLTVSRMDTDLEWAAVSVGHGHSRSPNLHAGA